MFEFLGDKVFSRNNVGDRGVTWGDVVVMGAAVVGWTAIAVLGLPSAAEHTNSPQPTPTVEAPLHQ